ncbi:MAG: histidinol-phosphatase, partial [Candidatus Zixiibacteriota bacterium]
MGKKVGAWYHYTGAIHMHTTESDGTKPIEDVIAIGQDAGLDFMLFSDHMTLSNRDAGWEGFHGDTLVLIGYEHNDEADRHHYLLFESPGVYPADMTAREYVAAGAEDGALGILAHPDEIRDPDGRYPPYPWLDWEVEGFDGIELWNQMSEWMEKLTPSNKLFMALSPRKSMVGPTDRILKKWDEINLSRRCVGIAGVDAHAFPISVGPFTIEIFPYKVHFRCLRTHILLDEPLSSDFPTAKRQFYDALRRCRVFGSNMRWGTADQFQFYAQQGDHKYTMGDSLAMTDDIVLRSVLPGRATIRLVRNGRTIVETTARDVAHPVGEPGLYRVEAWKHGRCW